MRAAAIGCVVLAVSAAASVAQSPFDDPQRRAYVVPYARAATDCLGRELLKDAGAVEATRAGRVREALTGPFRQCATDVNAMIAAHDRAYYPGAGEMFFQGAYLQDLPRAILRRVQPELDRQDQEAAQAIVAENARRAAEAAEQQKANDVRAAALWAENERKRADAARAQAARKVIPTERPTLPDSPKERIVTSDPAVVGVYGPGEKEPPEKSEIGWGSFFLLLGAVYGAFKIGIPALKTAMRRKTLMVKYGDENVVQDILDRMIWPGMTAEQLRDSWGHPIDVGSGFKSGKRTATYKYGQTGKNRFARRVYLEDDIVVEWEQK